MVIKMHEYLYDQFKIQQWNPLRFKRIVTIQTTSALPWSRSLSADRGTCFLQISGWYPATSDLNWIKLARLKAIPRYCSELELKPTLATKIARHQLTEILLSSPVTPILLESSTATQ